MGNYQTDRGQSVPKSRTSSWLSGSFVVSMSLSSSLAHSHGTFKEGGPEGRGLAEKGPPGLTKQGTGVELS